MESRRLAILASHLRPISLNSPTTRSSTITASGCSAAISPDELPSREPKRCHHQNDCVFCKIIRGDLPSLKIYEDDMCLCILDTNPLSHGHSLIIPKSHFASLKATPPSVVAAMCSKVPFISDAIMKATGSDSFNLLVNNGAAAGQVIFHTHIHIIPRTERDSLWASESLQRRSLKIDREAFELASRVRDQLSNLSEDSKSHESNPP